MSTQIQTQLSISTKIDVNSLLEDEEFKAIQKERITETRVFRDDVWLSRFCPPTGLLTKDRVLDYFCEIGNPFYDRESVNQKAKIMAAPKTNILFDASLSIFLIFSVSKNLTKKCRDLKLDGIYYLVPIANAKKEKEKPSGEKQLHIIQQKRKDRNSNDLKTQKIFYVYNTGAVYPAPNLHSLISSRLQNTVSLLNDSFKNGISNFARFSNFTGKYYWDFSPPKNLEKKEKKNKISTKKEEKVKERMDIDEEDHEYVGEKEPMEQEPEENEAASEEEEQNEENKNEEIEKEGDVHIEAISYSPYPSIVRERFNENVFKFEEEIRNLVTAQQQQQLQQDK